MKLTQRQVDVIRMLAEEDRIVPVGDGRSEFVTKTGRTRTGRVTSKLLQPLRDARLMEYTDRGHSVITKEGERAARHGISYEGPAEAPLNVQEYVKLRVRVRRQMRLDGFEKLRTAHWSDDPDEREIVEWWRKGEELLITNLRPVPPCGKCEVYKAVMQHDGETGRILTKVEV